MYALLDNSRGFFVEDGAVKIFETGQEAADYAKAFNTEHGAKFKPRPYSPPEGAQDWKARELSRFASGKYQAVPDWIAEHCIANHFVHVSQRAPLALAYTKDAIEGAGDKHKRISVVGYLETYVPSVSVEERERLEKAFQEWSAASIVKFAKTPDEIEEVYTNFDKDCSDVAESCMRYKHWETHPTRIYGAGDLAIAYLTNEDGETTARALVWPARLVYSRVYGTSLLHDLLRKLGYKKSDTYYHGPGVSFAGAKVLRIERSDTYVAPYIDAGENRDFGLSFCSDERYLVMSESPDMQCANQDGTADCEPPCKCERCGGRMHEDDSYTVRTGRWSGESWCEYCYDTYSFRCEGTDENYSDICESVEVDGLTYSRQYAESNFYFCVACDEWTKDSPTELMAANGRMTELCESCAQEVAFKCKVDGKIYALDLAADDSLEKDPDADGWQVARYRENAEQLELEDQQAA